MAHQRLFRALLLGGLVGCATDRPLRHPAPEKPKAPLQALIVEPPECATAECFRARATSFGSIPDAESANLGMAFALEPTSAHFQRWADALRASGQERELERAIVRARALANEHGGSALLATIEAIASLPSHAGKDRRLQEPTSTALSHAYAMEISGRSLDAINEIEAASANTKDPEAIAHLGDLLWAAGKSDEARRAWSRARIEIDERGATQELLPVTTWFTSNASWENDHIVLNKLYQRIDDLGSSVGAIDRVSITNPQSALQTLRFPVRASTVLSAASAKRVVRMAEGSIDVNDAPTGRTIERFDIAEERAAPMIAIGGEASLALLVGGTKTTLFDVKGKALDSFDLAGTTPTIMRVYRAHDPDSNRGVEHDNILGDAPSWATTLAATKDGRHIAIGGSDSKVRIFDRQTKTKKTVEYKWTYEERRNLGGNPDLNPPLDMRFNEDGSELTVIYSRGDLIRWSTASGASIHRIDGQCSSQELDELGTRYGDPKAPRKPPTSDELAMCARATIGALSPDGRWVATASGYAVRIRELPGGKPIAMLMGDRIPDGYLAFSDDGTLAMADIYGALNTWSSATGMKVLRPQAESGPITPMLSPSGRYLSFALGQTERVWDLTSSQLVSRGLGVGEHLVAIADDGLHRVVRTKTGLEIRANQSETGTTVKLASEQVNVAFSAHSDHVLFDVTSDGNRHSIVRDLASGRDTEILTPGNIHTPLLSPDGRRMLTFGTEPLQLWDTTSGKLLSTTQIDATTQSGVDAAAWAPDGSFFVTLERARSHPKGTARLFRADAVSAKESKSLPLDGWTSGITVSSDAREVLIQMQQGLVHWSATTDAHHADNAPWQSGILSIHYAPSGKVVFFEEYNRVEARKNDASFTLVATLYPLLSGGWLVESTSGAVDGSADAPDNVILHAKGSFDEMVLSGRASWDRWAMPSVYRAALLGNAMTPAATGSPLAPPRTPPAEPSVMASTH